MLMNGVKYIISAANTGRKVGGEREKIKDRGKR